MEIGLVLIRDLFSNEIRRQAEKLNFQEGAESSNPNSP